MQHFGELALRRPPSDDDVAFYAGTATSTPVSAADLANVIAVMLSSPRFLYHVESGGDLVAPDTYGLDGWELASRLSYHFWGTMPDAALRDAARSGALATDDGYRAQVDRLFAAPQTSATLARLLRPVAVAAHRAAAARQPRQRSRCIARSPAPTCPARRCAITWSATCSTPPRWVLGHGGSLGDLLTNHLSFARDADLAGIYGVAPWDGQERSARPARPSAPACSRAPPSSRRARSTRARS